MSTRVNAYLARLAELPASSETRLWLDSSPRVVGRFMRCQLSSAFQPIFDTATHRNIAREAFARSVHHQAEAQLSPWSLFASAASDDDLIALDRLCRTVHCLNHFAGDNADEALFLNVHDRLLAAVVDNHGRAFRRVLDSLEIGAGQIVIETPEAVCLNRALLGFVVANYRLNGFQISISVARPSELAEVLATVRPDFIKLDARRVLREEEIETVLAQCGEQGVRPIFQRVETDAQLARLSAAGVPLLQGVLLGEPAAPALNLNTTGQSADSVA